MSVMPGMKFKSSVMNASEDKSRGNRITNCGSKHSERNVLMKESEPLNSRKRRLEMPVVGQRAKRQKLDCSLRLQLRKILKELINHQAGWIFSEPIDPVKLRIPDYFSIITKPMDLGTILRKLEGNMYSDADEVVADVRLTFSNAMFYNPQWHKVHRSAKTLNAMLSRKLKSLEAKSKHPEKNDDFMGKNGQTMEHTVENSHRNMKPNDLKKAPLPIKLATCRLMSLEEKQKFRLELVQSQMIEKLQTVFQKFGLVGLNEEKLDAYIDSTDDETLLKLRREFKAVLSSEDGKVQPGKIGLKDCSSLNKDVKKVSAKHEQCIDSTKSGMSSVSLKCHCLRTGATLGSASDIFSERSEEQSHSADSKLEHKVKYPPVGCGLDSDGPVAVNEADGSHLSTKASVEGCCTFNASMSPKKALRAAMLKIRYAATIFKATRQEFLENIEKSDPLRKQQEIESLVTELHKEKDEIDAQIKAAEAVTRKRERDAARMALEKLEKSVEFDDNVVVLEDLKRMGCSYLYYPPEAIHHENRLQQPDLFCKIDSLEDNEDAILDIEEGEILS